MTFERVGPHGITHHYGDSAGGPRGGQGTLKGPDIHVAAFVIHGRPDAPLLRVAVGRRGE